MVKGLGRLWVRESKIYLTLQSALLHIHFSPSRLNQLWVV